MGEAGRLSAPDGGTSWGEGVGVPEGCGTLTLGGVDLARIEVVEVRANDVIVLSCEEWVGVDGAKRLVEQVRGVLGPLVGILILDGGMRFGVVRPAAG